MSVSLRRKIQFILFAVMGVLMAAILVWLCVTPNVETRQSRGSESFQAVSEVVCEVVEDPSAPAGVVRVFHFYLDDGTECDTTLLFRFSHQTAQVCLDDEEVYSLRVSDQLSIIRTPGNNWAMIPLYREDAGKEVRVILTPVYDNYLDQEIEFLIGSKLAVCKAQLLYALPEIILSLIDVLAGLALLCVAVWFYIKKLDSVGFYALALLAISLGLWNFTQTDIAPLLLQGKSVLIYYISLVMLMLSVIPLVKSVRLPRVQPARRILQDWCVVCAVVCIVQLTLQLLGVLDLREMLKVTHAMIVIGSLLLIAGGVIERRGRPKGTAKSALQGSAWILGVGALLDMALYYIRDGSPGLLFVLLSIFCYVLTESVRLFAAYIRQRQMLEEKETQLTLSRITTMMSQIRSHFVFNILNAISGMCKYDPEKADETVVRFARYLRSNIDIMENDRSIPFTTDLRQLEDYVALEQVRFGDKVEFYTDIGVDQFMIPPLILQPVVENAIKHGIGKKLTNGTIILRTRAVGDTIVITVEDDGVGFDPEELDKQQSVGLRNIRFRLRHLVNGTLDVESRPGEGTYVTITLPGKECGLCTLST